ncbi:MAG: putative selenate ABC transporter substrate-binding protein [Ilumatobacteraceae bacterium]
MTARITLASWRASDTNTRNTPNTPDRSVRQGSWRVARGVAALGLTVGLVACGSDSSDDSADSASDSSTDAAGTTAESTDGTSVATEFSGTLRIGAIPDQDPDVLQRQFGLVSDHLTDELGVEVEYVPVTDYQGAVSGFAVGDLDLVWFGGLTGVQARLEVEGAEAVVQRDIDAEFTSVFIAGADVGIEPFDDVDGLSAVADHSFTFGSESSTSGRLMPQYFLTEAGVDVESDLTGEPGFSGSHDATIELVTAGTYEIGALNSQVWDSRVAEGAVDTDEVVEIFRTPPYYDYHWVAQADLDEQFGEGFTDAVVAAFAGLDIADADDAEILDLFGAGAFIPTENTNYIAIEGVARDIGAIR